jgi:predicted ArsR family transcriptional regulator
MANTTKVQMTNVLPFLKRGKRTVTEVATEFGVTVPTARKYIAELFQAGSLATFGTKETGSRGRPATLYGAR